MAWSASSLSGTSADATPAASKTITGITAAVGTLVIVSGRITSGGGGLTGVTVSDSSGNTWNVHQNGTGSVRALILSTVIATGKALSSGFITVTRAGTTNVTSHALEVAGYTGSLTTSWEDAAVRAFASGDGYSATITGGAAANAGNLVVSALGYRNADTFSFTEAASWSTAGMAQSAASPSARDWSAQSYFVNSGTGAQTYTPTVTGGAPGGDSWVLAQTAFIAAGGGATYTLTASGGSLALSGQSFGLVASRKIVAASGSFTLSGQAAPLKASRNLAASFGNFSLAGRSAALRASRKVAGGFGAFALASEDASLVYTPVGAPTYALSASLGTFSLSGRPLIFKAFRKMSAGYGQFAAAGQDVQFATGSNGWTPITPVAANWTPATNDTQVWTPRAGSSNTWTPL